MYPPTPDPSMSLDAWSSYTVGYHQWLGDAFGVGVFGVTLMLFLLAALVVTTGLRR